MPPTFNDAYLDTWTGRRLLVLRQLGELPGELAQALAQGAAAPVPEAELRPVVACTTDATLADLSEAQRASIERLKDAVLADHGHPPEAKGRFTLSAARQEELRSILGR
jgi:hypothetical protein